MEIGELGPYDINQIYHGDCLDLMPAIPDGSIDMILADNPYGTTACAWDSIIPLEPLWEQYKRVIKPNGAIVLTASQPFTSVLVMSNLKWFKYEWIWDKKMTTGHLNAKSMPMKRHENVVVFSEGTLKYNPQLRDNVSVPFGHIGPQKNNVYGSASIVREFGVGYPTSILEYPKPNNLNGGNLHPTQKPIALFAYLIRTYSNPGDVILDNAAGSGTTDIAAIETGRNWLCIEKNEVYYKLAKERVEKRLQQPFLPGAMEDKVEPQQLTFEGQS